MSTAKLNVWVSEIGKPCQIANNIHQWYVHVLDCDGRIIEWCGKEYTNMPAKCGHLDVELPPGCYVVCASWSPGSGKHDGFYLGNHLTHLASVIANCGDDVCVKLFTPSLHHCGSWFGVALQEHIIGRRLPRDAIEAANGARDAVNKLLTLLPQDPFTKAMMPLATNLPKPGKK